MGVTTATAGVAGRRIFVHQYQPPAVAAPKTSTPINASTDTTTKLDTGLAPDLGLTAFEGAGGGVTRDDRGAALAGTLLEALRGGGAWEPEGGLARGGCVATVVAISDGGGPAELSELVRTGGA